MIAIKEGLWIESWIAKKELVPNTPGLQKRWQLFRWSKAKSITKGQIRSLRVHKIPLDTLKLFNRYQFEVDYQGTDDSPLETAILYSDDNESASTTAFRLAKKIQGILSFPKEIEKKEASHEIQTTKKKRKRI